MKKSYKIKLIALFLCAVMLLPMGISCGKKADKASAAPTDAEAGAGTEAAEVVTDPPTDPPPTTTPEPTTTEEPLPPYQADPSLPYWEQIQGELAHYGLSGGTKIFKGDDEEALMKTFGANNSKKEVLDTSGDDRVPFSFAYTVRTSKDMVNWWEASYAANFMKDVPTQEGDLIVGVFWIKGRRTAESDQYMADDPTQYYIAIKTPTDNWATEGSIEPSGIQFANSDEWQKVFFCGYVMNEETQSSTMNFNIYIGYGIQEFEIGGIYANLYPSTPENEKAAIKLMW